MNDFNEMIHELPSDEVKKWLFQENIRIQLEKEALQKVKRALSEEKRKITLEREALERKKEFEDKRFRTNEYIINQKQKILENGFRQLHHDQKKFEQEVTKASYQIDHFGEKNCTGKSMFFNGVNSSLALKKRYKDLIKIYHPDNLCGDEAVVVAINKEYEELKEKL